MELHGFSTPHAVKEVEITANSSIIDQFNSHYSTSLTPKNALSLVPRILTHPSDFLTHFVAKHQSELFAADKKWFLPLFQSSSPAVLSASIKIVFRLSDVNIRRVFTHRDALITFLLHFQHEFHKLQGFSPGHVAFLQRIIKIMTVELIYNAIAYHVALTPNSLFNIHQNGYQSPRPVQAPPHCSTNATQSPFPMPCPSTFSFTNCAAQNNKIQLESNENIKGNKNNKNNKNNKSDKKKNKNQKSNENKKNNNDYLYKKCPILSKCDFHPDFLWFYYNLSLFPTATTDRVQIEGVNNQSNTIDQKEPTLFGSIFHNQLMVPYADFVQWECETTAINLPISHPIDTSSSQHHSPPASSISPSLFSTPPLLSGQMQTIRPFSFSPSFSNPIPPLFRIPYTQTPHPSYTLTTQPHHRKSKAFKYFFIFTFILGDYYPKQIQSYCLQSNVTNKQLATYRGECGNTIFHTENGKSPNPHVTALLQHETPPKGSPISFPPASQPSSSHPWSSHPPMTPIPSASSQYDVPEFILPSASAQSTTAPTTTPGHSANKPQDQNSHNTNTQPFSLFQSSFSPNATSPPPPNNLFGSTFSFTPIQPAVNKTDPSSSSKDLNVAKNPFMLSMDDEKSDKQSTARFSSSFFDSTGKQASAATSATQFKPLLHPTQPIPKASPAAVRPQQLFSNHRLSSSPPLNPIKADFRQDTPQSYDTLMKSYEQFLSLFTTPECAPFYIHIDILKYRIYLITSIISAIAEANAKEQERTASVITASRDSIKKTRNAVTQTPHETRKTQRCGDSLHNDCFETASSPSTTPPPFTSHSSLNLTLLLDLTPQAPLEVHEEYITRVIKKLRTDIWNKSRGPTVKRAEVIQAEMATQLLNTPLFVHHLTKFAQHLLQSLSTANPQSFSVNPVLFDFMKTFRTSELFDKISQSSPFNYIDIFIVSTIFGSKSTTCSSKKHNPELTIEMATHHDHMREENPFGHWFLKTFITRSYQRYLESKTTFYQYTVSVWYSAVKFSSQNNGLLDCFCFFHFLFLAPFLVFPDDQDLIQKHITLCAHTGILNPNTSAPPDIEDFPKLSVLKPLNDPITTNTNVEIPKSSSSDSDSDSDEDIPRRTFTRDPTAINNKRLRYSTLDHFHTQLTPVRSFIYMVLMRKARSNSLLPMPSLNGALHILSTKRYRCCYRVEFKLERKKWVKNSDRSMIKHFLKEEPRNSNWDLMVADFAASLSHLWITTQPHATLGPEKVSTSQFTVEPIAFDDAETSQISNCIVTDQDGNILLAQNKDHFRPISGDYDWFKCTTDQHQFLVTTLHLHDPFAPLVDPSFLSEAANMKPKPKLLVDLDERMRQFGFVQFGIAAGLWERMFDDDTDDDAGDDDDDDDDADDDDFDDWDDWDDQDDIDEDDHFDAGSFHGDNEIYHHDDGLDNDLEMGESDGEQILWFGDDGDDDNEDDDEDDYNDIQEFIFDIVTALENANIEDHDHEHHEQAIRGREGVVFVFGRDLNDSDDDDDSNDDNGDGDDDRNDPVAMDDGIEDFFEQLNQHFRQAFGHEPEEANLPPVPAPQPDEARNQPDVERPEQHDQSAAFPPRLSKLSELEIITAPTHDRLWMHSFHPDTLTWETINTEENRYLVKSVQFRSIEVVYKRILKHLKQSEKTTLGQYIKHVISQCYNSGLLSAQSENLQPFQPHHLQQSTPTQAFQALRTQSYPFPAPGHESFYLETLLAVSLDIRPQEPFYPLDYEYQSTPSSHSLPNNKQRQIPNHPTALIQTTTTTLNNLSNNQISDAITELTQLSRFNLTKACEVAPFFSTFITEVEKTQQPWWMFDALLYHILSPNLLIYETLYELRPPHSTQ